MNTRKKTGALFIGLILILLGCQKTTNIVQNNHLTSFAKIEKKFAEPPAAFRTAPFMTWHSKVTKKDIDYTLQTLKEQGIGGFFIHPRYGLKTEYLSDEWFDLIEYTVSKAKSMDMLAWIYDENSFPSGFGGGHVPAEMPESINQGQGLVMHEFSALPPNAAEYTLILKKENNRFVKISQDQIKEYMSAGEYYLFDKAFYEKTKFYGNFSYVDLLLPGVTDKFIDVTMPGYKKSVGTEFGKTVPGVFADEPNIATPQSRDCIRWTPDLFERFRERWGYDLETVLPSLLIETGEWQQIRHNYYELLLELFIDRWSKPWYEYTEQNNLLWTGHYWEHGWPSPNDGPDNMAMYAWHHVPGVDMLFNNFSETGPQFGNARAIKELSSAANQMGRHRKLSETYGAAGWELTFQDMKRLGDWEYALGVNLMNQHLCYMTLAGDRKHDFPQSISWHAPWWPFYHHLADYYARLSLALSAGEQVNDLLILEPTTSAWMYYSSGGSNKGLNELGKSFTQFVNTLEHLQVPYDLGSENIIQHHGSVQQGRFVVGKRSYKTVVLPPCLVNLNSNTWQLLKQFVEQGGQLVSYSIPDRIDGTPSDEIKNFAASCTSWQHIDEMTESSLSSLNSSSINIDYQGGLLHSMHRVLDDGQLIFLVNSSMKNACEGIITLPGKSVKLLNALTGEISGYPGEIRDNMLSIPFTMDGAGSLLLFISDQAGTDNTALPEKPKLAPVKTTPLQIKRNQPNLLNLDYCTLELGGETYRDIYFYTGVFKIWQHHGFEDNPWVSSIQYKTDILDKDNFGKDTGFDATFTFTMHKGVEQTGLRAVIESPEVWQVTLNGQEIKPSPNEWYLDKSFRVFNIEQYVKTGENSITLSCRPMSIHAELEPVYIIGNFDLAPAEHGFTIIPATTVGTGPWKEQGLPFYAFDVEYSTTAKLDADKKCLVKLEKWQGTVVQVQVNNKNAGIIAWPPYELEISDYIKSGDNKISVSVYGSLKNVLGPFHNVSNHGMATPWSFKYAPEKQPKGKDYDLLDYGLESNISILQ